MGADPGLLARVQHVRRSLATSGPSRARSDQDFERVSLPADDADVLKGLFLAQRSTTVIEVGLAYGSSALAIAEALLSANSDNARHVIIDPYQDHFHDAGWEAIVEAGLGERCELIREPSQIALPRLLADGFLADAAFVDGSHIFHNVFLDLAYLSQLVRPAGFVVVDDYDLPSVATAARYFELNTGWTMEPISAPTRLRSFRLPDPRPTPSFENFRRFDVETTRPRETP